MPAEPGIALADTDDLRTPAPTRSFEHDPALQGAPAAPAEHADGQESGGDQPVSEAFGLLHPGVQRWVWRQGWRELRDIQELAIPLIQGGSRDAIVAAATASGKTEAAFLPIVSRMASQDRAGAGFGALYIGPLRALINDQFRRVELLCEEMEIPVFRWHGDVAASAKARARKVRDGIVLITPESLEALLVRRNGEVRSLFGALGHVVIDEMHAFMGSARGKQLQSLLHRLEVVLGRRVARVGLSATLADMRTAAAFLRPGDPDGVAILDSRAGSQELRLQVRGHIAASRTAPPAPEGCPDGKDLDEAGSVGSDGSPSPPEDTGAAGEAGENVPEDEEESEDVAAGAIADHLFGTLKNSRALIFAGSRGRVETYAAALADRCDKAGMENRFLAHHGSLSREFREEAERRMKDETRPASIVCTTTLEMGIDVGHIEQIAQIGPGHSVAGLRQRIGRSGRRAGQAAIMRIYVVERPIDARIHPLDALRPDLVKAVAMIRLMFRKWNEPPVENLPHLSTLLHQILALIAQYGGLSARQGYDLLIASGVFDGVDAGTYKALLRRMGDPKVGLIEQAPDGTLMMGPEGERLASGYEFYSVFATPDDYRVVHRNRTLGQLAVDVPLAVGDMIIFGGKRWCILDMDERRRVISVKRARSGKAPVFAGAGAGLSDGLVREMRAVWESEDVPAFLDPAAQALLAEGRATYRSLGLDTSSVLAAGDKTLVFPWVGTRAMAALSLSLKAAGLAADVTGIAVEVTASPADVRDALGRIAALPPPDPARLAAVIENKSQEKYDAWLGEDLLCLTAGRSLLDCAGLPELAGALSAGAADAFDLVFEEEDAGLDQPAVREGTGEEPASDQPDAQAPGDPVEDPDIPW